MLQPTPAVSVIIPTYKHRDFVQETLQSVFAQTFTDYEVIVVNDGSPDDTADVLKPLAEAGRIRYIEQENQGQGAARNRGLAEARGEFVALLDDDDLWPPDKLEWQVACLRADPAAALVYGYRETFGTDAGDIKPKEDAPSGQVRTAFLQDNCITSPGQTLIRTAALRVIGGCDTSVWGADDWDLYIRLAGQGEFVYRYRLALYYRTHLSNASKNTERMYHNSCRVQYKHLGRVPTPRNLRLWLACRRFIVGFTSIHYMDQVSRWTDAGEMKKARRQWLQLVQINPAVLRNRSVLKRFVLAFTLSALKP